VGLYVPLLEFNHLMTVMCRARGYIERGGTEQSRRDGAIGRLTGWPAERPGRAKK
jgi:hypothetical protein